MKNNKTKHNIFVTASQYCDDKWLDTTVYSLSDKMLYDEAVQEIRNAVKLSKKTRGRHYTVYILKDVDGIFDSRISDDIAKLLDIIKQ